MRVLALDHGRARIGCAVSDPTGTLVRPLAVIEPAEASAAAALAAELEAERIVVGLPRTLSGQEGAQAELVRSFCAELGGLTDIPVETYDERLTTVTAERHLVEQRMGAKARREVVDKVAAAVLLQSWLDATGDR